MRKIMVTTDFSPSAENAVIVAAYVAKALYASLRIFHCYHVAVPVGDLPFPPISINDVESNVSRLLAKQHESIQQQFPDLMIESNFAPGLASEDIIKESDKDENVALIVMGLTGAGSAGQWLFGSTSVYVARHSKKPVLLVPENANWRPVKEMVLACDFKSLENVEGLELFIELANMYRSHVAVLNVSSPGSLPTTEEAANVVTIDHKLTNLNHSYHFIEDRNIENGLDAFLTTHELQLLVMVHRNHNWFHRLFFSGHTGKIPYHSNVPVLILQERKQNSNENAG